jgi:hypothetical protein
MSKIAVKIRGIYSTALSRLFLDHRFSVASPSPSTVNRSDLYEKLPQSDRLTVEIVDREDRQGIMVTGGFDERYIVVDLIRNSFMDVICRTVTDNGIDRIELEFPYLTKTSLDGLRRAVVPTVNHHHRLRIINFREVDRTEREHLADHPEKQDEISRHLSERLIWNIYERGKCLKIEHVKMNGTVIFLSEGEIVECNRAERTLLLMRSRAGGGSTYDGLNIPKQQGDYAMTTVREGDFSYHHRYFRHDGEAVGSYFNINTPIECYPDKLRYVDLEVDVVRWPGGAAKIIDEDILDRHVRRGFLGTELQKKAQRTARELCAALSK